MFFWVFLRMLIDIFKVDANRSVDDEMPNDEML